MNKRIEHLLELTLYSSKQKRLEEIDYLLSLGQFNSEYVLLLKEKSQIEAELCEIDEIINEYTICNEMQEIEEFKSEYTCAVAKLIDKIENLEFKYMLHNESDKESAIMIIHSGAGGTESCDWVQMLFRMYALFCKNMNFNVEILDEQPGDIAGIKSITFKIVGKYSYGYLKAEIGVHRLIRNSPFDSNNKRHTSFASVDVLPDTCDEIKIQIKDSDLRWDYFRGSGAGGQHRNKTDSAVRIVHLPTGTIVQCQNERSKIQNEQTALKILKLRLYNNELKKLQTEKQSVEKSKINFGSQIRTYTLQPFQLIKDHRTNMETGNVNEFLNGNIKNFIVEYLKLGDKKCNP